MGLKEIKQNLLDQDKETLVKYLIELYKKYDSVKEYLNFYTNPNEEDLLVKYNDKIREGFYPKRGMRLKLSVSRKAINDFRKLGTSKENLGNLMLYYVECGVEFTNDFGDINESFYSSVENTFATSLKLIEQDGALEKYKERADKILKDSENVGWGLCDTLSDIYYNFYEE